MKTHLLSSWNAADLKADEPSDDIRDILASGQEAASGGAIVLAEGQTLIHGNNNVDEIAL